MSNHNESDNVPGEFILKLILKRSEKDRQIIPEKVGPDTSQDKAYQEFRI